MQSSQNKLSQVFMTTVGLLLLALALFLNHKHPHNEGIAALNHNSIYGLNLTTAQASSAVITGNIAVTNLLAPQNTRPADPGSTGSQSSPLSSDVQLPDTTGPLVTTVSASTTVDANDQCLILDRQSYTVAVKSYKDSYAQYKKLTDKNTAPGTDTHDQDTYYQTYLDAIKSAYENYQTALTEANCTPIKDAPVPRAE